jgi:multiple antibiotic resistance protein
MTQMRIDRSLALVVLASMAFSCKTTSPEASRAKDLATGDQSNIAATGGARTISFADIETLKVLPNTKVPKGAFVSLVASPGGENNVDFIKTLGVSFAALFPIVNPLGDAPIFFGLTQNYPQSAQKVLARKIAAYGFVLLVVSALFGSEILAFFGISLFVVQIAGGLVVAATGWNLLNQPDDDSSSKQSPGTLEGALQHAFFPLTLPLTVGPGAISIAITLGAHLRYQAGPGFEHGYPRHFIAAAAGMLLVCLLVVVCYGNAARMVGLLGKSGTSILTRLSAFILLAIGVQIFWNGLSVGILQMLAHTTAAH